MSVLATGLRLPVHFENQVVSSSVANLGSLIDAAKIKSRLDHVYALVKVVSTEDDQVKMHCCCVHVHAFMEININCCSNYSHVVHFIYTFL